MNGKEARIHLPTLARGISAALETRDTKDDPASMARLITGLIDDAVRERSSDIHLDPFPDGCWVRFRVDGCIIDTVRLEKEKALRLSRAIKNHASLDTAYHPKPQDGWCEFAVGNTKIPVRIATAPCVGGEKIAIRFLPTRYVDLNVKQLGMLPSDLTEAIRGVQETSGMVLISGPTGSGKTTTAYALLRYLLDTPRSIATIEDPVEFHLDGVPQMQINTRQGLTFREGVAGLLRLDPDVIMLGEIRDEESARAALNAADGGHLFISTLHARDAAGTITALRNYSLRDYEIAANLNTIIAQRLVRRLCLACRKKDRPTRDERRWMETIGASTPRFLWRPVGCNECSQTGYRGRIGIFEVVRLSESDIDLICKRSDEPTLRHHFRKTGARSLLHDDLQKISEGITSLSEIQGISSVDLHGRRK